MFKKIRELGLSTFDKMTQRANTLFTSMKDKEEERKSNGLSFSLFSEDEKEERLKRIEQEVQSKTKTIVDKEQQEKDKMQKRADILYSDSKIGNKIDKKPEEKGVDVFKQKEEKEKDIIENKIEKEEEININDNIDFSNETIKKAREFIGDSEGLKLDAYQDGGGIWTIGYGHTKNVKQGDKITKEEAEKLYREDFEEHIKSLKEVKVPLTDNQKVALSSFIYNIGGAAFKNSTMLKKLNNNDFKGAANEFDKWIYDNGKKVKGLINRRKKEKMLFLQNDN